MEEVIFRLSNGDESAEEIRISDGVTTLPDGLFRRCAALKRVYLPKSVTRLGHGLFSGLSDIDVYYCGRADAFRKMTEDIREERDIYHEGKYDRQPFNSGEGSYYSKARVLIRFDFGSKNLRVHTEDEVLYYHLSLDACEELSLPPSVDTISSETLRNKESLRSVRIPDTVKRIGYAAFAYAEKLQEVYIPDSVEDIDRRAFFGCVSLVKVRLPKGLKRISNEAFCCCRSLSELSLPEGLLILGDYALSETALTSATLPKGLTVLGDWAFSKCKELKSVTLPDGLKALPKSIFNRCEGLTEITLPPYVKRVGEDAFAYCTSLASVYYLGEKEPKFDEGALTGTDGVKIIRVDGID